MNMDIYVVINEDRHIGVEVRLYNSIEAALADAKDIVESCNSGEDDIEEQGVDDQTPYNMTYSCEGDAVRVEKLPVRDKFNAEE
jgi:hypothetical protein